MAQGFTTFPPMFTSCACAGAIRKFARGAATVARVSDDLARKGQRMQETGKQLQSLGCGILGLLFWGFVVAVLVVIFVSAVAR